VTRPDDTLLTDRLSLRRFTWDDLPLLLALQSDPAVMEHLGGVKDRPAVEALLRERILAYYDRHPGLGVFATLERASGRCVGFHVLNHMHGESHIQVGYALFADAWGRGYATEMTVRLLGYGFGALRLATLVGVTNLANTTSQRVLLKAGLRRNGERTFLHSAYAGQGPMAWFEAHRDEWLAAAERPDS
jgi:RimJ/RimL family protein N-acetyltransferase